ncbi:MAG TPA: hypothetical protein VL461_04710 [Dictyobacter sp.]|jgi:sporulation protein YlmC with PRC-barrel domain|nr:hypothetical protein [Dictyobacter sp.]
METKQAIRKWSDVYKLDVVVPSEGKSVGYVEDLFMKEGSNAVYGLCVRTRLYGDLTLPVTGIIAVENNQVTIRNAQMLLRSVPPHARSQQLLARKVVNEKGNEIGTIKDIFLGVENPSALHVAGFEIAHGSSTRVLSSEGVVQYDNQSNTLIVHDQSAKKLH